MRGRPLRRNTFSPKSTFTLVMIMVALVATTIVGSVAWTQARDSVLDSQFNNLTSVRNSKARQIENYFDSIENQTIVLSEDISTARAMVELSRGFRGLERQSVSSDTEASIEAYYTNEFFPRLGDNLTSGLPAYNVFRPNGQSGRHLQHHYIAANSNAVGFKQFLDDAGDGSAYSDAHALYHPNFRHLLVRNGFYDIFLVDFESRDVVYSVFKEVDYGTNLRTGPYRNSGLADVVDRVAQDPIPGTIQIVDYQSYLPSYNAPAAFVASPVFNGEHVLGILVIQIPTDQIDAVMSGDGQWAQEGLGESGHTYLVGPDRTMRSKSRLLTEDRQQFLETLEELGTQEQVVSLVDQLDSNTLLLQIDTEATRAAAAGVSDTRVVSDYRNVDVLSSFSPVNINGLDWVLVAEIDAEEAFLPVDRLLRSLFTSIAILIPLIALASIWIARRFMRPAERLIEVADSVLDADGKILTSENNDEFAFESGPGEFGMLGSKLNSIADQVRSQNQLVERFDTEYSDLLRQSVPLSAAERRHQGEGTVLDITDAAAAVALRLTDFGAGDDVEALVRMRADMDEDLSNLAEAHGVDLFSNVGMEYVGLCGLTMRFINFAERSIEFANAAATVVASYNNSNGTSIGFRAGIDVSDMVGTLIDRHKTSYDVLGPAIGGSQQMISVSEVNTIAFSASAIARLGADAPDDLVETEVQLDGDQTTVWTVPTTPIVELRTPVATGGVGSDMTGATAMDDLGAGP